MVFALFYRGFFPVVVGFIRRVPILGYLLNLPGISSVSIKLFHQNTEGLIFHDSASWAIELGISVFFF